MDQYPLPIQTIHDNDDNFWTCVNYEWSTTNDQPSIDEENYGKPIEELVIWYVIWVYNHGDIIDDMIDIQPWISMGVVGDK